MTVQVVTKLTESERAEAAADLKAAAAHLRRVGWFQGNFAKSYDRNSGDFDWESPCCVLGAIIAAGGFQGTFEGEIGDFVVATPAAVLLSERLRVLEGWRVPIHKWQDTKGRTLDEVLKVLEQD